MSSVTLAEYGEWKSPISARLATESSVGFSELHVDRAPGKEDVVYWTETRFDEGGRYVVCSSSGEGNITQLTPTDLSSRTRVHEYGGGAVTVYNGTLYFSNFADQRLYVQNGEDAPRALTPDGNVYRYADGDYCSKLSRIYMIREDHTRVLSKEASEPVNTVVVVNPSNGEQHVLASGCDFYTCPRASPNGAKLVWVQWVHPNMPWDGTELWMADLNETGDAIVEGTKTKIAGGDNISITQPQWTPDNQLLYISDESDWWNLYYVTPSGEHVNLRVIDQVLGGPHWEFAHYAYDVERPGGSRIVTAYGGYGGELGIIDMNTRTYRKIETGYQIHTHVQFSSNGNIYCVAGSPTRFSAVIRVNVDSGQVDILKESRNVSVDPGYLSVPEEITWPTGEGGQKVSHGYLYLPKNKDYKAPESSWPPLLVQAHGGPTGQASNKLSMMVQYFTTRGFAVLDTNYRGSTGYGRPYMNELLGNWGIVDVEDCCSGAQYLVKQGQVDGQRLCIDGGSAGGYTTLACLAFKDVFKAGASHYGIGDVKLLAGETHKFESRYCSNLIAPYKEENFPLYEARSPICHIDQFNCPIAFFQGDEDQIVPPNQAQLMFDAVKSKGLMCALTMFEGEQHGFRKAENLQKALDGEFYFFAKAFGFQNPDVQFTLEIENLPQQHKM